MRPISKRALQLFLHKHPSSTYIRALSSNSSVAATGLLGYCYWVIKREYGIQVYAEKQERCRKYPEFGKYKASLPTYSLKEIRKHDSKETRIWVTFREGVYDITDYIKKHPGGEKILISAIGGQLEPLWTMYPFHEHRAILQTLEMHRIGNLALEDQIDDPFKFFDDPYINDPVMHSDNHVVVEKPYIGSGPLSRLGDEFYTPNEHFYVRNHLPVPQIDPNTHTIELEIEGTDNKKCYTLDDLKRMKNVTVTAALMCSGNRREEMVKAVPGAREMVANLTPNFISNAQWTGVPLSCLLKDMGITTDEKKYKHVQFIGLDKEVTGEPYSASIPIFKATDPYGDVILAYEMNGAPLPPMHGFPIRAFVPGHTGARSVKWLKKVLVSEHEAPCHYQQIDYKLYGPNVNWKNVDYSACPALQMVPVNSAVCRPNNGDTVHVEDGCINIKGYAYSGGGQKIIRLDVTSDGGETWHTATLDHQDKSEAPHHWAWTLWSCKIPVKKDASEVDVWCKAVDSSGNVQPESFKNIFSWKGCPCNAYNRVKVKLSH
ncbi:sulfite oxidase, mitochondrial-like isoform X2 [Anthonomus grandis grandis]|uniref:sulfite oxidase, mitochondrial-like isoform X2 n=1 Tax=Anthonomus grandis grandis TaxID=2921223 RepID=UPI002165229E|nr:sulfite oxidase, mitochondrial-like isoform X2 [Anthonomus grandis grandis]